MLPPAAMEDTPPASAPPAHAGGVLHAAHHDLAGAPPPPSAPPEHAGAARDVIPVDDTREPQRVGASPPHGQTPPAAQPPQPPRESATDLPGCSAAWSAPPMPAEPASLVGRRVRREFLHAGEFGGVITGARLLLHFGWLWHIRYEDGDREELPWRELSKCLVPVEDGAGDAQPLALAAQLDDADMAAAGASPSEAAEMSGAPSAAAQALADAARPCPDADAAPRFKGVIATSAGHFCAKISIGAHTRHIGTFPSAIAAAQAFDNEARKHGRRVVNLPLPGSNEVQAVPGEVESRTLQRATAGCSVTDGAGAADANGAVDDLAGQPAAMRSAPRAGQQDASARRFKGVTADTNQLGSFRARFPLGDIVICVGTFPTAVAAAHAYDAEVRNHKRRVVNFPLPGSDEVQAVPGEVEEKTLQRAADYTSLVGRRVRVPFTKCNATSYYDGTVLAKRTRGGELVVRFDDGDECGCSIAEVRWYSIFCSAAAVDTAAPSPPAATAVASPPPPKRRRLPQTPATLRTDSDAVADFLRGITPPLQQLDAIVATLPSSGITMAHLERLAHADVSSPLFPVMRADLLDGLGIKNAGDKFSFTSAVAVLLQPDT